MQIDQENLDREDSFNSKSDNRADSFVSIAEDVKEKVIKSYTY